MAGFTHGQTPGVPLTVMGLFLPLPRRQPSLEQAWASPHASLTLHLCSGQVSYLPGARLPVLAGPSHELSKPTVTGKLHCLPSN